MSEEIKNEENLVEITIAKVDDVILENGRSFKAYRAIDKKAHFMDCKFRKECKNIPTEPCIIVVREDDANVDTKGKYATLWVKDIVECKPFIHKSNLREFF